MKHKQLLKPFTFTLAKAVLTLSLLTPSLSHGLQCHILMESLQVAGSGPRISTETPVSNGTRARAPRTETPPTRPTRETLTPEALEAQLRDQDRALWRIDLQHFYERAVQFLQRRVTVSSVRSTLAQQKSRQLNLMHFLAQGKHSEAIDIYRNLFDNVEVSYFIIKNTQEQLAVTGIDTITKVSLEKRLLLYSRKFAQGYGEYIQIRSYLESINAENAPSALFLDAAQKTIRYLGAHKFSETHPDFAALRIPEQRVSLREVQTLFRSQSQFTRLKLLGDFRNEILSALRYLVSAEILVSSVDSVLSRFPPHAADKLKNLVGLMRSAQLRNRTLPQIVEIESLPLDIDMRLTELRKKNSVTVNDELLVTYARTVEFTDSFNAIRDHAKLRAEEPDNVIAKQFYDRMLAAQDRATKLPDISLYERISNIDVMYTLIQAGIIIKVTAPEVASTATEFFNLLLSTQLF